MAEAHVKNHDYHIIPPSPWPALAGLGTFVMALGGIGYMRWLKDTDLTLFGANFAGWGLFVIGLLVVLYTMYAWWSDTIAKSHAGAHTPVVLLHLRYGMLLFIASEVMFFFAFFWAYFHSSVPAINRVAHTVWPPEGIIPFDTWGLPFLNTLILLTSGATVTIAHHAVVAGDKKKLVLWTGITALLGIIFLICQAFEYSHAAFGFTDGIYPSTFFMATGFHGFHVFVGTCFLIVCFFRARAGHFTPKKHIGFEAAAWYWHFVDVVWLFLFVAVYWWGSSGYHGPMGH